MEKQEYSIIEHQIDKSARLLMYTDGISEAFNSVLEQYDGEKAAGVSSSEWRSYRDTNG
jgi:hypothetical protein